MSAPVVVVCEPDRVTPEDLATAVPTGAVLVDAGQAVGFVRAQQPRAVVVAVGTDTLAQQPLLARLRAVAPEAALVIVAERDASEQVPAAVAAALGSGRRSGRPPPYRAAAQLREAHAVPIGRQGATDARAFVRELLESWHCDDLVQDAELVVSELVANAVLHAGGPVEVTLTLAPATLRVEVRDMSRATPELLDPNGRPRGGHGLRILMHLAVTWGVQPTADGKVVWADLAR